MGLLCRGWLPPIYEKHDNHVNHKAMTVLSINLTGNIIQKYVT